MFPKNQPSESFPSPNSPKTLSLLALMGVMLWINALLLACTSEPPPPPTPSPTPTHPLVIPNNQNVDALNAAKAALGHFEFGFASLLEKDETRVVIEPGPEGEIARLAYPSQPARPGEWSAGDSFILSYAVQQNLLQSPHVLNAAMGRFGVAAPLENLHERVDHMAVWVRFSDGSQAIVDFSPLASSFGSLHTATELLTDPAQIGSQFTEWRQSVPLNHLQPMKVVSKNGNVYYLLAGVTVAQDYYEFSLRVHLTQTATPIRPLQLTRGAMAKVSIKRSDFETLRQLLLDQGPQAFNQKPELFNLSGDPDPAMRAVMDDHLPLLWHLVTKLEPSTNPPPTPAPTATPTPTHTPIPLPQETS